MKKCIICERKESEIELEELPQSEGDDRKLIHYSVLAGEVEICTSCRHLLGQRWLIHPKVKK